MQIMRRLMIVSLSQNIHFYANHIQEVKDIFAYLLSQLQVSEFKTRFSHLEEEPYYFTACSANLQVKVPIV